MDAELGCVTPYIVVPGAWTPADIEYYADEIVAGLVHNAGHNCTKAELLVTDADWPLRDALIDALRCALHPHSTRSIQALKYMIHTRLCVTIVVRGCKCHLPTPASSVSFSPGGTFSNRMWKDRWPAS